MLQSLSSIGSFTRLLRGATHMHPIRKLRELGHASVADYEKLLAENVVFHSPVLVRAIEGRAVIAKIFATSTTLREGAYIGEWKGGHGWLRGSGPAGGCPTRVFGGRGRGGACLAPGPSLRRAARRSRARRDRGSTSSTGPSCVPPPRRALPAPLTTAVAVVL